MVTVYLHFKWLTSNIDYVSLAIRNTQCALQNNDTHTQYNSVSITFIMIPNLVQIAIKQNANEKNEKQKERKKQREEEKEKEKLPTNENLSFN